MLLQLFHFFYVIILRRSLYAATFPMIQNSIDAILVLRVESNYVYVAEHDNENFICRKMVQNSIAFKSGKRSLFKRSPL